MFGAVGYGLIEVLWRGHTHWSMLTAGGFCFVLFTLITEKLPRLNILYKAVIACLGVTAIEFIYGCIFNIWLNMNVWNYSKIPFNIAGQVCLLYTVMWGILAFVFIPLSDIMNKYLQNEIKVV